MTKTDLLIVTCPHGRRLMVEPSPRQPIGGRHDSSPRWLESLRDLCVVCRKGDE